MLERNHDREKDNSDDDDEALLREKALKSLAVKRKAYVGLKYVTKINLYLGQMCNDSCTR